MLAPSDDADYSLAGLIAQQLASVYVASLPAPTPDWFCEGTGRVIALRLDAKAARVRQWNDRLHQLAGNGRLGGFVTHSMPQEDNDIAAFGFMRELMANAGSYAEIDVTGPIDCDDAVNLCQFTLTGINRAFVIRGTTAQSGFYRRGEHGGYKHNTLTIQNSSGSILLRDLTFDEGKNMPLTFEQFSADNPAVSVWTKSDIPSACARLSRRTVCCASNIETFRSYMRANLSERMAP